MDQLVGPLQDKVVIYLCWPWPFPNAAMMLGDLGAKVIKVESPGSGDDTRGLGPPFVGPQDKRSRHASPSVGHVPTERSTTTAT
jgi:formyl-CoA transferase